MVPSVVEDLDCVTQTTGLCTAQGKANLKKMRGRPAERGRGTVELVRDGTLVCRIEDQSGRATM